MPRHLANLLKAEVRKFAAHPDQPASSYSSWTRREPGSALLQRDSSSDVLLAIAPRKMHVTNTDTVDCFGNGMAGFVLRQNCNCNARQNKSNACINDTGEAKGYKRKKATMCMSSGAYT